MQSQIFPFMLKKTCTACSELKDVSMFSKNLFNKDGLQGQCKNCNKFSRDKYYAANKEKTAARGALYYAKNREIIILKAIKKHAENPCKRKIIDDKYRAENKEKIAAYHKTRRVQARVSGAKWRKENTIKVKSIAAKWAKNNPDKLCAKSAARRAKKLQACPSWSIQFIIDEAYQLAKLREKVCGGKWHVDHIIPLNSNLVCGLHVHNNLQVIPAIMNILKSNKHCPNIVGGYYA